MDQTTNSRTLKKHKLPWFDFCDEITFPFKIKNTYLRDEKFS